MFARDVDLEVCPEDTDPGVQGHTPGKSLQRVLCKNLQATEISIDRGVTRQMIVYSDYEILCG